MAAHGGLRRGLSAAVALLLVSGPVFAASSVGAAATTAAPKPASAGGGVSGRTVLPRLKAKPATASLPNNCYASGTTVTCSFSASDSGPATQYVTVPAGIGSVDASLYGAEGGGGGNGGNGGYLSATLSMPNGGSSANTLGVNVASGGGYNGSQATGGWPDGGGGGSGGDNPGCGGGGGTQVVLNASVIAEAAGGGGCGGYGAGVNPVGGGYGGGSSGSGGSGGNNGNVFCGGAGGGGGASQTGAGGGGGGSCSAGGGSGGGSNSGGGGGGGATSSGGGGGGGGGGWYGGGGGGGGTLGSNGDGQSGGGGGGGSSDCSNCSISTNTANSNSGDGYATIQWSLLSTSLSLDSDVSQTTPGGPVNLTAYASASGYVPTGTISFDGPNGSLCQNVSLTNAGSYSYAQCATDAPYIGTDSFDANYSSDGVAASASTSASVQVNQEPTVTGNVSASLINSNSEFQLSTTVTPQDYWGAPGGTMTFSWSLDFGSGTVSTGTCAQSFTSSPSTTTTPLSTSVTCDMGNLASGGTYNFTAAYGGDTNDSPSSSAQAETYNVPKASTSTSISLAGGSSTTPTYGNEETVTASVTGIPSGDTTPGTLTYEYSDGTPVDCAGSGTTPLQVSASGSVDNCTLTPSTTENVVDAVYNGDNETDASESPTPVTFTVTAAGTSTALAVTAQGDNTDIGVPITLGATVTNSDNTGPGPDGTVEFFENGTPVPGCTAVATSTSSEPANTSVATCTGAPAPSSLTAVGFSATFTPAATGGSSDNWVGSTSSTVTYSAGPDPTTTSLSPTAPEDSPISVTGGDSVTVTATVALTAGNAVPAGEVTFLDNGSAVAASSGGSCSDLGLTVSGTSGTVTCVFVPTPGTLNSVVATYNEGSGATDADTMASSSTTTTPLYYKVSGAPVTVSVDVEGPNGHSVDGASVAYGTPLTLISSVTSGSATVNEGTVDFTVGGSAVTVGSAAICQNVPVSGGTATCATTFSPAIGLNSIGATYGDASQAFLSGTATATAVTVDPAATSTTVSVGPDPKNTADVLITTTVTNTSVGSTIAPTGTVAFTVGSTTHCASTAVTPSASSAVSTASCEIPASSGARNYSAAFSPGSDGDFASSASSTVTYPTTTACSSSFGDLWLDGAGSGSTVGVSLGSITTAADSPAVDLSGTSGNCDPSQVIAIHGGSFSIMGKTLATGTGASAFTGYVEDVTSSTTTPTLCLTGGQLNFPTAWRLSPITLGGSSGDELCFSILSATKGASPSVVLGSVTTAQLSETGITLPFGTPDSAVSYSASISFDAAAPSGSCSTTGDQVVLSFAPESSPGSSPYLDASVTVTHQGSTVSACGAVSIGNLFTGGGVSGTFTVTAGGGGALAGSVTFAPIDAGSPISPAPGVSIENVSVTLSSTSGLAFTATGLLGASSHPLTVTLDGSYSSKTWTLSLSAATNLTWSPFSSLTFSNLTLNGTVTITTAGKVTFDIEAGTAPTGPGTGSALVAWNPVSGVSVGIDCLALAYGVAPKCGASSGATETPTDATLVVEGFVTAGTDFTAGIVGTLDLTAGSVSLDYDSALSAGSLSIANGLTITIDSLSVSGSVGGSITFDGQASADIPVLQSTPVTVTFSNASGQLVIAVSGISLQNAGIPVTGFFAYASGPVSGFDTSMPGLGTVDLVKGFNAYGIYTPSAGVVSALAAAGFNLADGDTITFSATWTPGSAPTFAGSLQAPSGFPFLTLPDGGSITGATLTFASGTLTFAATGSIPIPNSSPAAISLTITISTDGAFSGSATVSGFVIFGQQVGFTGSISRTAAGKITADIQSCQPGPGATCTAGPIAGPFTPFSGVPLELTNVDFEIGTSGLTISGTATVDNLGSLSVSGTLQSLKNWSITIAAAQAQAWQPAPGVSIDAELTGTVSDVNGAVSFSLAATGAGGGDLFTLSTGGVTVSVTSVQLGNASPPSGCTVANAGDLYLFIDGSLSIALGSTSGSANASGCFDLTAKTIDLTATIPSLSFSTAGVSLSGPTISLTEAAGKYTIDAQVPMTISMPSGGSLSLTATIQFESGNGFVVGFEANLSQWLGSSGDTAYVYYASQSVTGFVTGDPTLQPIDLPQGIDFAMAITVPQSVLTALGTIGINLPTSTSLTALGNLNLSADTFTFKIEIGFGSGMTLLSTGGTSLVLDDGYLKVQIGGGQFEFGVGLDATLDLPAAESGDAPSSVGLTGELDISDTGISVSLQLGNCTDSSAGWVDAFGVSGFTVKCAALQGGIAFDGLPNVGLEGVITSLPSSVSNAVGYQDGAPITFAFNLNPFLLDLSIGTENSGTPALEPFAAFGQASLLEVDFASLYISPTGATIGQTTYPAGFGLAFQGSVEGVQINVLADIGIAPPSINFTGSISQISIDSFSVGPVSLTIAASPSNFEFQFQGTVSFGPGTVNIGPDLQVGGSLSATVQIEASTSGISAFIWGNTSVSVAAYVATETCWWENAIPYPCNWQWESTSGSFTLNKTGFSVTGSGVTLEADGYSITFDYSGSVSITTAAFIRHLGSAVAQPAGAELVSSLTGLGTTSASGASDAARAALEGVSKGGTAYLVDSSGTSGAAGASPKSATPSGGHLARGHATVASPAGPTAPVGSFLGTGSLATPRAFAVSAALHNGEVLVAGGVGPSGQLLSSAEIYDAAEHRFVATAPMSIGRVGASAVTLPNGDVLVVGGLGKGGVSLSSAELFDPSTGRWKAVNSMSEGHAFAVSAVLAGGNVLVAGGFASGHVPLASAVEYDASTGDWTQVPAMSEPRAFAAGGALPNGGVLVAGGYSTRGPLASAEVFDPSTSSWRAAGSMASARYMISATALENGDVLVVGDGPDAQRYDPGTNSWISTQQMSAPRTFASVVTLDNGEALVLGGDVGGQAVSTGELYDPGTNAWTSAGSMSSPGFGMTAVTLHGGNVLVAGGVNALLLPSGQQAGATSRNVSSLTPQSSAELYSSTKHLVSVVVTNPVPATVPPGGTGTPGAIGAKAPSSSLGLGLGLGLGGALLLLVLGGGVVVVLRRRAA